jgi:hypothetical protein
MIACLCGGILESIMCACVAAYAMAMYLLDSRKGK